MADDDDDALGPLLRRERRRRLLSADTQCTNCGRSDVIPRRTGYGILCGACHTVLRLGQPTERQHVIGRANSDLTVPCDTTLHDRLSDAQRDWPSDTLRNRRSDPALRWAAELRSAADLMRVVAPLLEAQAERLENSGITRERSTKS